ncbi:helix-turn-helix transcriptional regulator [Sphingobacterium shayense]|uniref:AraC family transcriptional regulator n=1 Tax=Sphingobacterium shayense TaxID=626343 RepID=UPI0015576C86|nr:AraC family transcriptional regulator [Sphingobacterium shayense]NQD70441.1 helix-turn-helix transcriptional regulator [Sphingobacterium shayense]
MKLIQFSVPSPRDKSVYVQEDKLSNFYPYFHKHEEYQLMWIVQGEGTLFLSDNFHTFQTNDIFLLGPNQPHVFKKNDNTVDSASVETVSIFFNLNGGLSSLMNMPELRDIFSFILSNSHGFKVPQAYTTRIKRRISLLRKAESMNQLLSFVYLLKELSLVANELKPLSLATVLAKEEGFLRINDVCRYIKENFRRSITLEEAADHANLTPQAFCRYFKKHTGLTFVSYVNELRIQEACTLITAQRYESIGLVAYNSGFNSITNFNRVFRSITGCSPKEYFAQYRNKVL